jgi:hypothetical protein
MPWPPPMQAEARPRFRPRRRSSSVSVSSSRVPLSPSGWPSAMAPPLTLTLSRSSPSSFSHRQVLRREGLVDLDQVDVAEREPAFSSTLRSPAPGPMPISVGSTPT